MSALHLALRVLGWLWGPGTRSSQDSALQVEGDGTSGALGTGLRVSVPCSVLRGSGVPAQAGRLWAGGALAAASLFLSLLSVGAASRRFSVPRQLLGGRLGHPALPQEALCRAPRPHPTRSHVCGCTQRGLGAVRSVVCLMAARKLRQAEGGDPGPAARYCPHAQAIVWPPRAGLPRLPCPLPCVCVEGAAAGWPHPQPPQAGAVSRGAVLTPITWVTRGPAPSPGWAPQVSMQPGHLGAEGGSWQPPVMALSQPRDSFSGGGVGRAGLGASGGRSRKPQGPVAITLILDVRSVTPALSPCGCKDGNSSPLAFPPGWVRTGGGRLSQASLLPAHLPAISGRIRR